MDLLSAKREAQLESKKLKKTVYVIVDDEGECSTSGAPLKGAIFAYTKGAESPLPLDAAKAAQDKGKASKPAKEKQETKTTKVMATKKKAAKKSSTPGKRAVYGVGKQILETLQKGGAYTKEALVKKFKMAHPGHVNFHVSLIRKNGHNVELTDKGYKLTK